MGDSIIETDDAPDDHPSTAEQAVPWLIGVILLLAGMVIVLLALIFAGPESLGALGASPSASILAVVPSTSAEQRVAATPSPRPSVSPSASPTATTTLEPTPSPVPPSAFGPLEMVYQGRSAALAPIYLLRHDFTIDAEPDVMAQDASLDVRRFAWSPDGTAGAGLLADVLVSIEPGEEKRRLGDGITTTTFGADASTIYAVRVTQDGDNDVATVLSIDFGSADTTELASVTFARPDLGAQEVIAEAQFTDDGGPIRLFFMEGGALRLWARDAGTWDIEVASGDVTELDEALPRLWAPDGSRRVGAGSEDGTTTLTLVDADGETVAETTIAGRVSHLRWSPDGERMTFTLGRSAAAGGVLQDLFLWDLVDDDAPMQLTSTGAAFGAEWLGSQPIWRGE